MTHLGWVTLISNYPLGIAKSRNGSIARVGLLDHAATQQYDRNSGTRRGNKEEDQLWGEKRGWADCMREYALDTRYVPETGCQFLRVCAGYILKRIFGCTRLSELVAGGVADSGVANSRR